MGYGLDFTQGPKTRQQQKCVQWITLESWRQRVIGWLAWGIAPGCWSEGFAGQREGMASVMDDRLGLENKGFWEKENN
jgi:hypothetical protein